MKTLEEFKSDAKVYDEVITNASIRKYRAFMDYVAKIVPIILKDDEQEIISWLNENDDSETLILSVCTGGIHYIHINIGLSNDKSHINVVRFAAHDQYYDPVIDFDSTDESINKFFRHEYDRFLKFYTPYDRSIVDNFITEFVNLFNDAFYEKFRTTIQSIGINNFDDFKRSKYALNFSDEKLSEIGNQILPFYDTFSNIAQESSSVVEIAKRSCYVTD